MIANTRKAWTAGLGAWLGNYVITGAERMTGMDIPLDIETAILGIIVAGLAYLVPNA